MVVDLRNLDLPELLAPAGNLERLDTALTYGADAVYLGGGDLNLRAQSQGFDREDLGVAVDKVHAAGKKIYYCLNIIPTDGQLPKIHECLENLRGYSIDALIVADPGVLAEARRIIPEVPVHLSTQANTTNSASIRFWKEFGVQRINLARELNLRQIRKIRENVPEMELETFVHGAMCMAVSGRCFLSSFLNRRSANQGWCTHPCRYNYRVACIGLEEEKRPGRIIWEVCERGEYSDILASEDLCLIKYLNWFVSNQIQALKIEGRMKTSSYLAQVVDVYSTALWDLSQGKFRPRLYLSELGHTAGRQLGTGFFLSNKRKIVTEAYKKQNFFPVLCKLLFRESEDTWRISVRHRFDENLDLQVLVPGLRRPVVTSREYELQNIHGEKVKCINSGLQGILRSNHPDLRSGLMLKSNTELS